MRDRADFASEDGLRGGVLLWEGKILQEKWRVVVRCCGQKVKI